MDDETDRLSNLCTDLVSLRRLEPGVVHLFQHHRAGEWVPVRDLYRAGGDADGPVAPGLVAAWLPAPTDAPDYAVVVFFDAETQWSSTAYYNRARLLVGSPVG
jgi:hypothetical protein